MKRYEVIQSVLENIQKKDILICANGRIYREAAFLKDRDRSFYLYAAMGHASSVAFGLAMVQPQSRIFILDGDGNVLMNLGGLAQIGYESPSNLVHIILDNEGYGTTGGQKTLTERINLNKVSISCGYKEAYVARKLDQFEDFFKKLKKRIGPSLIVAKVDLDDLKEAPIFPMSPEKMTQRFLRSFRKK